MKFRFLKLIIFKDFVVQKLHNNFSYLTLILKGIHKKPFKIIFEKSSLDYKITATEKYSLILFFGSKFAFTNDKYPNL